MARAVARRGALIVVEGVDRVGKSTHCMKLVKRLNKDKCPAEYCNFPKRDTPVGQLIHQYLTGSSKLDDHVIHLLFSANRWETVKDMREKLIAGTTLIVDRYAFSGVAYSAAKETIPLAWCKAPDSGLLKPDLVIYLTASAQNMQSRSGFGDEVYESSTFLEKVKKVFETMRDDSWKVFETDNPSEELDDKIFKAVQDTLKQASCFDLKSLWSDNLHT